jgi:transposase-like protein
MDTPKTLQQAIEFFSDELRAIGYFVQVRWPDGNVKCPTCGAENAKWLDKQKRFQCKSKHPCRQFSVKVGTIFEDSPLPLKHWLLATWQLTNCKNGLSSYELARAIGVTQKSAWFMLHRIRLAMQSNDRTPIDGEVEIDETYIGGTCVSVEPFHLFRYLDEQALRFNERTMKDGERFDLVLGQVLNKRLMFNQLIGGDRDKSTVAL